MPSHVPSFLDRIQSGRQARPRRTLLYGTHGVGKSTFGACAPDPIFIQTEDGLGDLDCSCFPLANSFGEVEEAVKALAIESHGYQTLVLDSLDWLEKLIWSEVCQSKGVKAIEDIGYAKGYQFAIDYWRHLLRGLESLRQRGMAIILLAHARVERFESPDTEPYDRYTPALHKTSSAIVQEWCDEVLFASHKVLTKKSGEKFGVAKYKGVGTGERIIRTVEKPTHLAKRRIDLPDEIELAYPTYAHHVRQALAGVVASDPILDATPTPKNGELAHVG